MKNNEYILCLAWLTIPACLLSGCASQELSYNAMQVGVASNDLMYNTVLLNIAMIRNYPKRDKEGNVETDKYGQPLYSDVIPVDSRISAGQDVVNDTAGVTASAALGGAHGIVVPNISLPYTHSVQQQANSSPSTDAKLLIALMRLYQSHANDCIFHSGKPPIGVDCFSGHYLNSYVWVDSKDMGQLTDVALAVLGGKGVSAKEVTPENIYCLRKAQQKNQSNKIEDASATSIRTL